MKNRSNHYIAFLIILIGVQLLLYKVSFSGVCNSPKNIAVLSIGEITKDIIPPTIIGTNLHVGYEGHLHKDYRRNQILKFVSDKNLEFNPKVMRLCRDAGISIFRFPGGNTSDYYHWRQGVGALHSRKMSMDEYKKPYKNYFGTIEFAKFVKQLNAEMIITVNYKTGSSIEAANWVEFCNGHVPNKYPSTWEVGTYRPNQKAPSGYFAWLRQQFGYNNPLKVKYWEVGNEIKFKDTNYLKRAQRFAEKMKTIDPSIKVGFSCQSLIFLNKPKISINKKALKDLDFMVLHYYGFPHGKYPITIFYKNGESSRQIYIRKTGYYIFSIEAKGTNALGFPKLEVLLNSDKIGEIKITSDKFNRYKLSHYMKKGKTKLTLRFINDRYIPNVGDRNCFVRSVLIKLNNSQNSSEIWQSKGIEYKYLFGSNLSIERQILDIQRLNPEFNIMLSEANTGYGFNGKKEDFKESLKVKSALWTAGLLNTIIRNNIPIFCHWALYGKDGGFGIIRPDMHVSPTFYVLKMYHTHVENRKVNCSLYGPTFSSPMLQTIPVANRINNVPFVDGVCSFNEKKMFLVVTLINRSWQSEIPVQMKLGRIKLFNFRVKMASLIPENGGMEASNEINHENVKINYKLIKFQPNCRIKLKPNSINNLIIPIKKVGKVKK